MGHPKSRLPVPLDTTLCMSVGLLENNSKQTLFVETPSIRMKRLGLTNYGEPGGKGLLEGLETPIDIHIIHQDGSVVSQGRPCPIQFESYVAFGVQAVVNEEINLPQSRKQPGKPSPARTLDVGPPVCVAIAHCGAHMRLPELVIGLESILQR